MNKLNFQWFKLKNVAGVNILRTSECERRWESTITACRCESSDEISRWLIPPFHVIPAYSEYASEWKLHICSGGPALMIQTCYREIPKHYFTGDECVGVSPCLCCLGGDAAGAPASRRPPDETGGGHGSGLRERDHDPHALPPERDHHLHIQTGTAASPQAATRRSFPATTAWKSCFESGKVGNSDAPYDVSKLKKTNHSVWKQRLLTHSFIIQSRCPTCYADVFCICEGHKCGPSCVEGVGGIYPAAVLRSSNRWRQ